MEDFKEYATFKTTNKDGEELELAVVDEFDFENKHYVVGALIEGDTINGDGLYIYKAKITDDDFTVEKIKNQVDYQKIARAYMELEDSKDGDKDNTRSQE